MKKNIGLIFLVLLYKFSLAQPPNKPGVFWNFATAESRAQLYKKLIDTSVYQYLSLPPSDSTEGEWNHAFWAIELLEYKNDFVKQKIDEAWQQANLLSEYFQKNLLEATYSLYPVEFSQQITVLLHSTPSVPVFVRCAEYLLRADGSAKMKNEIQTVLQSNFSNVNHVGLTVLQKRIATFNSTVLLPPLKDLFSKSFLANKTVIYSLQRKNRDYPGLVVIRKADGNFAKNIDGSIFHTSQLARAVTNYPFYITNGNTPQGIFRWTGFEVSKNNYIGPTPNLQLLLPLEANPVVFFGDNNLMNTVWQKELYASLLPASWKNNESIYESFFAGAMGRNAIIMHGTTVDPSYYKGQSYYPQTPSLGCLCSYEEWDKNGFRIKSNQQQIVDILDDIESNEGYVLVIELNDEQKPVNINDVAAIIASVEKNNRRE